MTNYVDDTNAEGIGKQLGIGTIQTLEAFRGEPIQLALSVGRWLDRLENAEREDRGAVYVQRHFDRGRILRAWARKAERGGFRRSA